MSDRPIFCVDCKFYRKNKYDINHYCDAIEIHEYDLVTGEPKIKKGLSCYEMRSGACGVEALMFSENKWRRK